MHLWETALLPVKLKFTIFMAGVHANPHVLNLEAFIHLQDTYSKHLHLNRCVGYTLQCGCDCGWKVGWTKRMKV